MMHLGALIIGSVLVGIGTNAWVGSGVVMIALAIRSQMMDDMGRMYTRLIENMRVAQNNILKAVRSQK